MTNLGSDQNQFHFELFVAGDAPNSAQALTNLRALCQAWIPRRYVIEVVDVFQNPGRAMAEGIFMTPTLLRLGPLPKRRIVGTLSHSGNVIDALGLVAVAA
jgi:circadian clock protein KaiB